LRKGDSVQVLMMGDPIQGTVATVRDGGYRIEIAVKTPRGDWWITVPRSWIERADEEDFWSVSVP